MTQGMTTKRTSSLPSQKIHAYCHKALEELKKCTVDPTPENYMLWFRHVAGLSPDLSHEIQQRHEHEQSFDKEYTQHLFKRFAAPFTGQPQEQLHVVNNTQHVLTDALSLITAIISEADMRNAEIEKQLDHIIVDKDQHDINTVLNALVAVAKQIRGTSVDMRASLEESRQEVETLQQTLENISTEAQRDFLTGIYNRKALHGYMEDFMRGSESNRTSLSLCIGDIDHFKKFNDTYGHLIGDEVLKMVARMMSAKARKNDIVARFGGEEFIVLMPDTGIGAAMAMAESIRHTVAGKELRHKIKDISLGRVTMSLGVATYKAGETSADWLNRADAALYRSKRGGRNRVTQETITETYQDGTVHNNTKNLKSQPQ